MHFDIGMVGECYKHSMWKIIYYFAFHSKTDVCFRLSLLIDFVLCFKVDDNFKLKATFVCVQSFNNVVCATTLAVTPIPDVVSLADMSQ